MSKVSIIIILSAVLFFGIVFYAINFFVVTSNDTERASNLAIIFKKPILCRMIVNPVFYWPTTYPGDVKASCISDVAIAMQDSAICSEIDKIKSYMSKDYFKEGCYSAVAKSLKDVFECDKITNSNIRSICYADVVMRKISEGEKDMQICNDIPHEDGKGFCYKEFVKAGLNDGSVCDNIDTVDDEARNLCYLASVGNMQMPDVSYCEKISNSSKYKDYCYLDVAKKISDIKICDFMSDGSLLSRCYTHFLDRSKTVEQNIKNTVPLINKCLSYNNARLFEPINNKEICSKEGRITKRWFDLDKYDGLWGGCQFFVKRDGDVVDFQFCATLVSGKILKCTSQGCCENNQDCFYTQQ